MDHFHPMFGAIQDEWLGTIVIAIILGIIVFALIAVVIHVRSGGRKGIGAAALRRRFEGIEVHTTAQPGDVTFRYHTYRGFLVFYVIQEHGVTAPPDDALRLLGRLLRFNLTWGLLSRASLFMPVVAIPNYLIQRRSIRRQIANAIRDRQREQFDEEPSQ